MKKILVATESLGSGGVEVSLIRFLTELTKIKNIKVDLLLLKKEGIYLDKVPKNVKIIEIKNKHEMYNYTHDLSYMKELKGISKIKFFIHIVSIYFFRKINRYDLAYKILLRNVERITGYYDLAIDYLGYGHFLSGVIASKVNARKKAMWIHDEKVDWLVRVKPWINNYDKLFCVGKSCLNNIANNNPKIKNKLAVFYNMTDYQNVRAKALEKTNIKFKNNVCNIVTVGRLEWQKAHEIAIETAKILKERNFKFNWYLIGGGTKENELKELVKEYNLEKEFIFLGVKPNPFPIVKMADLYVLSSRHEGYCLATLEAKILDKVIIATDIESNREQITNGINGFLCPLDSQAFADKIIEVYDDKVLMDKVKTNLLKENFDYTSEFEKINKMLR